MSKSNLEFMINQARVVRDALNKSSPNNPALVAAETLLEDLKRMRARIAA
jgi:hypothetical protein